MSKIVFIGAGSGFGARSFVDIMSFPALHDSEFVLVDINPQHLEPVAAYCRKVAKHYGAPTRIATASGWRDGALDGADYVITSFAQGGPAYQGVPYHYEMAIPRSYGIYQGVGDTAGIAGVFRLLRTAPELLAIARDLEVRSPGAYLLNYVNPMSMLTRTLNLACPLTHTLGLCHNIGYTIRDIARWLGQPHTAFRYRAAGINHMDWFLRLEYLDGRDAYPDLMAAARDEAIYHERAVQFELLKHLGYFTTESSHHCAEYLPYYMPRAADRTAVFVAPRETTAEVKQTAARWGADAELVQQTDGRRPLDLERSFEYAAHIIHALETEAIYRMHLNVQNRGEISNLPLGYCVEVECTVDRTGISPHFCGALPVQLAALCRGMADMQTLASDAVLEHDLNKAFMACVIDPTTAASATPARIKACFNELLKADEPWLREVWGEGLRV
jgi:alpha-galactosidase